MLADEEGGEEERRDGVPGQPEHQGALEGQQAGRDESEARERDAQGREHDPDPVPPVPLQPEEQGIQVLVDHEQGHADQRHDAPAEREVAENEVEGPRSEAGSDRQRNAQEEQRKKGLGQKPPRVRRIAGHQEMIRAVEP